MMTVAAALRDFPAELRALLRHPAISPGWVGAWSAAFGAPGHDPALLAGAGRGRVEGVLLLSRRRTGPLRLLHSTTNGHSQYAAFAAREGRAAEAAAALLRSLEGMRGWDALRLQGLADADAAAWERAAGEAGHAVETERRFDNLVLDVGASRPGAETGKRRAQQERALMRSGDVRYEAARGADLPAALAAFRAAEGSSWKAARGELISAAPEIARFYDGLAAAGRAGGPELAIRLIRRDGAVVAGLMTAAAAGTEVALKVFYAADAAKHSPGALLLRRMCEEAGEDSTVRTVDFFSTSAAYAGLAGGTRSCRDLTIWRRSTRARALRQARRAARMARRWRGEGGDGHVPA